MTRSRSRKLLSRILWLDPGAGDEGDSAAAPIPPAPLPSAEPAPQAVPPRPVTTTRTRSRYMFDAPASARTADIYTEHFGLTARPFALTPDPDFLF